MVLMVLLCKNGTIMTVVSFRDSDIDVEALRETVRNSIISREVWKKRSKNGKPKSETDPKRLEQRQKQIDFGKNTLGYDAYSQAVPRYEIILKKCYFHWNNCHFISIIIEMIILPAETFTAIIIIDV